MTGKFEFCFYNDESASFMVTEYDWLKCLSNSLSENKQLSVDNGYDQ